MGHITTRDILQRIHTDFSQKCMNTLTNPFISKLFDQFYETKSYDKLLNYIRMCLRERLHRFIKNDIELTEINLHSISGLRAETFTEPARLCSGY